MRILEQFCSTGAVSSAWTFVRCLWYVHPVRPSPTCLICLFMLVYCVWLCSRGRPTGPTARPRNPPAVSFVVLTVIIVITWRPCLAYTVFTYSQLSHELLIYLNLLISCVSNAHHTIAVVLCINRAPVFSGAWRICLAWRYHIGLVQNAIVPARYSSSLVLIVLRNSLLYNKGRSVKGSKHVSIVVGLRC